MAGTYEQSSLGEPNSTAGPKWLAQFKGMNDVLNSENDLTAEGIAKGTLGRLYTPTIIATEQTRESATFGTLTTKDEVTSVVLPENGLIAIGFWGKVKCSVGSAGRVAIFLGANQLKIAADTGPLVQEGSIAGTEFTTVTTGPLGISGTAKDTSSAVTTGQLLASQGGNTGGLAYVFAAAGTYTISVQFRATSGSITAKERKLWVGVLGV